MDDGIQDFVRDHYERPYHRGGGEEANHVQRCRNDPCGDEVELRLLIENRVVRQAWFDGRGCVVSQAAASMLIEKLEGCEVATIREFSAQAMLRLFAVPLAPTRRKCCLLAWDALQMLLANELDEPPDSLGWRSLGHGT